MNDTFEPIFNWTSPRLPLWQVDCEEFRKSESPFELRDVGPEHERFIHVYATRFGLDVRREGSTIVLIPNR